jgi:hypothetical protein
MMPPELTKYTRGFLYTARKMINANWMRSFLLSKDQYRIKLRRLQHRKS